MPKVQLTVPEHLEMQIAQLVEEGEFVNREEAIEELCRRASSLQDERPDGRRGPEFRGGRDDGPRRRIRFLTRAAAPASRRIPRRGGPKRCVWPSISHKC